MRDREIVSRDRGGLESSFPRPVATKDYNVGVITDNLHDRDATSRPAADRRVAAASQCVTILSLPEQSDRELSRLQGPPAHGLIRPDRRARRAKSGSPLVRDLVRDDVVLSAQTWVVKVGTSVLTGPDGTLDPARIDHLAEQISTGDGPGPQGGAGQLGSGRRRDGPAWLEAPARQSSPASGGRGGRPGLPDPRLRRRLCAGTAAMRPNSC